MRAIYFDMDGTIANLYGVENWLAYLEAEEVTPYICAKPLCNMSLLARYINKLQQAGYHIGIVSWTSKCGTVEYNNAVVEAKMKWLATHLRSVRFDECKIIAYGTNKRTVVEHPNGILFDDEERNRKDWALGDGLAFDVDNILAILKAMI